MQHEVKSYKCRHIFADGRRCGSPALRKEEFCYYHHTNRIPLNHTRTDSGLASFDLGGLEDRNAIQRNLGEVLQRLANDKIQPKRAALLLYGLSIASSNLSRATPPVCDAEPVEEVVDDLAFGLIALPDERPLHGPDDTQRSRRGPTKPGRENALNLARVSIDRTTTAEVRMAAAEALFELTQAEYVKEFAEEYGEPVDKLRQQEISPESPSEMPLNSPKALPVMASASVGDFTQPPQYIGVDDSYSPRYSQFTSRYPMATSG